jgi:hypothetical protein
MSKAEFAPTKERDEESLNRFNDWGILKESGVCSDEFR